MRIEILFGVCEAIYDYEDLNTKTISKFQFLAFTFVSVKFLPKLYVSILLEA